MSTHLTPKKYSIALKTAKTSIDIYDIFRGLPNRLDPAMEHAVKKLLNPGGRGAKGLSEDCTEAIMSIQDAILHQCEEQEYLYFLKLLVGKFNEAIKFHEAKK